MLQHAITYTRKRTDIGINGLSVSYTQLLLALSLLTLLCFCSAAEAENTSRIVKWKDEKGVTHYGDKIPPQYVNRENSEINKQGVTIKHNKPNSNLEQTQDFAKREQDKKDKALLGAYTNAEEIDLARDRNVQLDLIALENLNQEKISQQKKLSGNKALADSYTKRKKPVPDDLAQAISNNQEEIARIDQRILDRKQIIERTRQRFDENKKRYLELKGLTPSQANKSQPTAETQSTEAASLPSTEKPVSKAPGFSNR